MKTTINVKMAAMLLIQIILVHATNSLAQNELRYKVKQEFTGEIRDGVVSVYSVTCIIDRSAFSKYSRLYLKMGSRPGLSDLFKVALDSADVAIDSEKIQVEGVRKSRDAIEIDMGDYTSVTRYIEVWTKEGRYDKRTKRGGDRRLAIRDDRLTLNESN